MCDCNREIGQTQYQPDEGVDKDVALKVVDETIVVKRLKELDNDIKAEKLDLDFYFAEDPKDAFEDDGCLKIIAPRIESVEGFAWKFNLPKDAVERYLKESGIPPALARANSALIDITMIARRFAKKYWQKNAECKKLECELDSLEHKCMGPSVPVAKHEAEVNLLEEQLRKVRTDAAIRENGLLRDLSDTKESVNHYFERCETLEKKLQVSECGLYEYRNKCSKLEAENCSLRGGETNLRVDFRNLSDDADSLKKELDAKTEECAKLEAEVKKCFDVNVDLIRDTVALRRSKTNLEVELDDAKFDNTCKFITGCAAGVIASAIVATIAICLL